jgi:hypothetical protein
VVGSAVHTARSIRGPGRDYPADRRRVSDRDVRGQARHAARDQAQLPRTEDIETYRPLDVEEDLDRYDQPDPTLTLAEANALAALHLTGGKHLRTQQERIPISHAEHALEQARNLVQSNATEALR